MQLAGLLLYYSIDHCYLCIRSIIKTLVSITVVVISKLVFGKYELFVFYSSDWIKITKFAQIDRLLILQLEIFKKNFKIISHLGHVAHVPQFKNKICRSQYQTPYILCNSIPIPTQF